MTSGGSPVGYVLEPGEGVNYVENHDNLSLFDNNAFKLPAGTSREDCARVQMLVLSAHSRGGRTRLRLFNTSYAPVPTLAAARIDGTGYACETFKKLVYVINIDEALRPGATPPCLARPTCCTPSTARRVRQM